MSTKEAQRRARAAHRARQKVEGWRQKAFWFAPDTLERLARLAKEGGTSEAATIAHALAKLEEAQQLVPIQALDVDAEERRDAKHDARKPIGFTPKGEPIYR